MISNEPPAPPKQRSPEPRTPLNVVFRRLADQPPNRATRAPAETPASPIVRSGAGARTASSPSAGTAAQPRPGDTRPDIRVPFGVSVLAQAGAAIAARSSAKPRPHAAPAHIATAIALSASDVPALVEPVSNPPEYPPSEPPAMRNRRLYRRVGIAADIEINGAKATLVDLSLSGFAATKAPTLAPNKVVPVTLRMSIDGVDVSTRMQARMIYHEERRSGGRFVDLTTGQTALLRYLVTRRGHAVGALAAANLLETIARAPEGHPPARASPPTDASEPGKAPKAGWWSRWFGWLHPRAGSAGDRQS